MNILQNAGIPGIIGTDSHVFPKVSQENMQNNVNVYKWNDVLLGDLWKL